MRFRIILEGDDLKEDVEGFVADVENTGTVDSFEDDESGGYCITVDKIQLVVNP